MSPTLVCLKVTPELRDTGKRLPACPTPHRSVRPSTLRQQMGQMWQTGHVSTHDKHVPKGVASRQGRLASGDKCPCRHIANLPCPHASLQILYCQRHMIDFWCHKYRTCLDDLSSSLSGHTPAHPSAFRSPAYGLSVHLAGLCFWKSGFGYHLWSRKITSDAAWSGNQNFFPAGDVISGLAG